MPTMVLNTGNLLDYKEDWDSTIRGIEMRSWEDVNGNRVFLAPEDALASMTGIANYWIIVSYPGNSLIARQQAFHENERRYGEGHPDDLYFPAWWDSWRRLNPEQDHAVIAAVEVMVATLETEFGRSPEPF